MKPNSWQKRTDYDSDEYMALVQKFSPRARKIHDDWAQRTMKLT